MGIKDDMGYAKSDTYFIQTVLERADSYMEQLQAEKDNLLKILERRDATIKQLEIRLVDKDIEIVGLKRESYNLAERLGKSAS